uniref:Hint domain-containing protein n=1 Tax=Amphimedon queenslandica TaxID=400682 RepID=A0A1X7UIG2_AMPQE
MLIVQTILVFSLLFIRGTYSEVVPCNHNTPVCKCTATDPTDVCEFRLDIEMLQTFTRYVVDATGDSRGTAGRVWNYNDAGNLQPQGSEGPCGVDIPLGDNRCTDPFTVDGYTFRSFIAVNGRIPGPTLIVTEGQLVKVNVINRLASESVSVHWHGMHQRNSNWMDGVEHVTQCGIPPGASFTYIFKAEQYGTHWYHSHSGAQRTDGLFGALIVKEKDDKLKEKLLEEVKELMDFRITSYEDSPEQHTLILLDWQKSSSLDLFTQIHSTIRYFDIDQASEVSGSGADRLYSSDGAEIGPVPYWSGLINGRGRHNSVDYIKSSLSEFKVTAGKTYRFRLIGAQSLYAYRFSIDGHKLIIIATDGQYINPKANNVGSGSGMKKDIVVDYIIIHSGERYDFLLQTKNENEMNKEFMMRAVILSNTMEERGSAEAILNYNQQSIESNQYQAIAMRSQMSYRDICTSTDKCEALNCPFQNFPVSFNIDCIHIHDLESLTDYPGELPDVATSDNSRLFFNFGFEGTRQTSTINGRNLKLPSASLAQLEASELTDIRDNEYCKDEKNENDEKKCDRDNTNEVISQDCYCTHVVDAEADRPYELVISAVGPNPTQRTNFLFAHPVHLHGHYFHVVDIQFGTTDLVTGRLIAGNSDIDCGGDTLCVRPRWKPGKDYSTRTGVTGRVSSKAPLKDTLLIPAGGYAVVYFKTDNPGWWFLHCHIEVHQLEGMGVIINEGGFKTPPPGGMYKCGDFPLATDQFISATAVTPLPTSEPTGTSATSPNTNSGGGGGGCFPPDAVVRTRNGPLLMKDVEIGMELLAVSSNHKLVYSPVILMLDVDDIKLANYTIIESSGNHKLTLTPNHLVHASKTNDISSSVPIFASQVKKGDKIFVAKSPDVIEAVEVFSTSSKVIKGAYAPLTREGTVVVNDVVASCYAVVNDHQFAHATFGPLRYFYDTFHTSLHSKQKQGIACDYAGIAERIQNVSRRCTDRCVALNCPFKEFPEAINIDCMHITDLQLLTDYPEDLPTIATDNSKRLFFNFGFEGTRRTSSVNGRNLKLPSASLAQLEPNKLTDIENNEYCMDPTNNEDANTNKCDRNNEVEVISSDCHCTHVVDAEADSSIELVLSATGSKEQRNNYAFAHPIHLHGHYFHVVEIAFGEYDNNGTLIAGNDTIDCGDSYLCVRPRWKTNKDYSTRTGMTRVSSKAPLKDTLLIPAGGYAVVYFKTDNPGWWFLHCHIEVHQLEGMGVIINEGGMKTTPPDGMYKCGNFSLTIDEFKGIISNDTSALTPVPTLIILLLLVLLSL